MAPFSPRKAWGSEELKAMRKIGKLLLLTMKLWIDVNKEDK